MPKSKTSLNDLLYDIRRIEQHREVLTENKIKAIYRSLEKSLNSFVAEQYVKYADKDGRMYVSSLDAARKKAWFLNEIVKNVDDMTPALKKELTDLVNKTYSECYKGMEEAIKKADTAEKLARVTKDISVRPEVLNQAVNNNISKLTLPRVLERNRAEIIYQIQQELNIGLMNGDRYETMARRISDRIGVSESKAKNIARTETHRNIESGFMDCAERLSEKLEGSDLIYAATWRNMGDERVRPQVRRKTKKGWKTSLSRNGANHIKMEGQTVRVGELFNLGNGVKAKAPSQSGVAAHDCNCRCFLEYNLMTPEEFAKATGRKVETVQTKVETTYESVKLSGIDDDYVPDITDTFNGLMNDYPIAGISVKTHSSGEEFGHSIGGIKGVTRNGEQYAIADNEISISKQLHKNRGTSIDVHRETYSNNLSKLESAERADLATIPHEYAHAIDNAYVLAKDKKMGAFVEKYKTAQKVTAEDIETITDFNIALSKSDSRLSKEIFDELQAEYGLSYGGTIMRIADEYGMYASSSISEFLAEGFANMRMLDDSQKTDFMKSFERIFNRKYKEVLGG